MIKKQVPVECGKQQSPGKTCLGNISSAQAKAPCPEGCKYPALSGHCQESMKSQLWQGSARAHSGPHLKVVAG